VQDRRLVFYGQAPGPSERRYTGENVYWLTSGLRGLEMAARAAPAPGPRPATSGLVRLALEENQLFQALAPEGSDAWMWSTLYGGAAVTHTFDAPGSAGGAATLVVRLLGTTDTPEDPDHRLAIWLNGTAVADERWDGAGLHVITATLPAGQLQPSGNELRLEAPGDTGAAAELNFVDGFELLYPRALVLQGAELSWSAAGDMAGDRAAEGYAVAGADAGAVVLDVSDPAAPVRLTGLAVQGDRLAFGAGPERYAAARLADAEGRSDVRLVAARLPALPLEREGADYLVIAPGALAEAAQPLLAWRADQGLRVKLVVLEDVYDAYGGGLPTPEALRAFLRATQADWTRRPRYVVLAGDASYDTRDYLGAPNKNWLATQLVYTEWSGQTASDVWYTLADDGRPQFALGRLPAGSPDELAVMVAKIQAYERAAPEGWGRQVLLAADGEAEFRAVSDNLAADIVPPGLQVEKIYFGDDRSEADARAGVLAALEGGVAVANYVGHGSLSVWGDEKVLTAEDAAQLDNGPRLPLLVTYSCLNGFFQHPEAVSLAEAMLRQPGGGIVAALVPSGRTFTVHQQPLMDDFYRTLFSQPESARLGDALLHAQRALPAGPGYDEVLLTFNLLGDPGLRFIANR
jgi:hypothetical protein